MTATTATTSTTSATTGTQGATADYLQRYQESVIGVFGRPQVVISHGEGRHVVDVDGRRYLDLVGGIAVSALGHAHPALTAALTEQVGRALHVSNLVTTPQQIEAAERLLAVAGAPEGSGVFFANSGSEVIEAAIKLSRRTGREEILVVEGGFHGRTTGAVSLTHKPAYRAPFAPLLPGVRHVPADDLEALAAALSTRTAMVLLEPIRGEAGVIPIPEGYLHEVRRLTRKVGALLVMDEVQTGVGRTGEWFAHQRDGIVPDAMTVAKGLGGGVPVGALITYGPEVTELLTAGQHGSTFGGNPLACTAALTVLRVIEEEGLLAAASARGAELTEGVAALAHPLITGTRGRGLMQAIVLREPVAAVVAALARDAGYLVNPVAPDVLRVVPPLTITSEELATFVAALPELLDRAADGREEVSS